MYKPLEERLKQLKDQFPRLEGEIDYLKSRYLSKDEILHEAKDLYSRWPKLDREEKRQIIENITEKITIGQKDITIDLCYLPSASEIVAKRQRSRRDSNPRYLSAQRFSRPSRSTTLPLLRIKNLSEIYYGRVKNQLSSRILKSFYNRKTILQANSAARLPVFDSKKKPRPCKML